MNSSKFFPLQHAVKICGRKVKHYIFCRNQFAEKEQNFGDGTYDYDLFSRKLRPNLPFSAETIPVGDKQIWHIWNNVIKLKVENWIEF